MKFHSEKIILPTSDPIQLIDITNKINHIVSQASCQNGLVVIQSGHTTAGICINEKCPELEKDLVQFLKKLVPTDHSYAHNQNTVDGRLNAHSHLLSYLISTSQTLIIQQGKLNLGSWQRVFFLELDGPRKSREVAITILGQ